ncbi:MAG: CSLREA domain-containing protein [Chloroflexota bacterium]
MTKKYSTRFSLLIILPVLGLTSLFLYLHQHTTFARSANTVTVNTLQDEEDGSCQDGDCSLRDAIETANSGDLILFDVSGVIDISPFGILSVTKDLMINGNNQITISGNNSTNIFEFVPIEPNSGEEIAFTIEGLTFTKATGDFGSVIRTYRSVVTVTINNSQFINNSANDGIITTSSTSPIIINNSSFVDNISTNTGGVIFTSGEVEIYNSLFLNNRAKFGGAIYNVGSTTIHNSQFLHNQAEVGGAITSGSPGDITIANSTYAYNESSVSGGAIHNFGLMSIVNSTISSNIASNFGGGIYYTVSDFPDLELINSTVTNNQAGNNGGGIYFSKHNEPIDVVNTIISGNYLSSSMSANDFTEVPAFTSSANNISVVSHGHNVIGHIEGNVIGFETDSSDRLNTFNIKIGPLEESSTNLLVHIPMKDSFLLNSGNTEFCPEFDQLGAKRGTLCDIGAVERLNQELFISVVRSSN